jgi:hypothetical protein
MATVTDPGASYGVPRTPTPRLTGASIRPAHPANSMIGQKRRSGRSRLGRGPWVCGLSSDIWSGAARASQGMAGRPCSIMAQPGGLRRPGFGPGWERFANPPPPTLFPVPDPPVGECANTGFPFPSRPLSDDSEQCQLVERVAQRPGYPSVRTGSPPVQATSPGWVRVSIAPVRAVRGCHSLGSYPPDAQPTPLASCKQRGRLRHRDSYDGRLSLGRATRA